MESWRLKERDLKRYPHFDPIILETDAEALATNSAEVARHRFYPFIRYFQRWNRFAEKGEAGKPKERQIRYAARRDAYIYSYYRYLLSQPYEAELARLGLTDAIIAYRRIAAEDGGQENCASTGFYCNTYHTCEGIDSSHCDLNAGGDHVCRNGAAHGIGSWRYRRFPSGRNCPVEEEEQGGGEGDPPQ